MDDTMATYFSRIGGAVIDLTPDDMPLAPVGMTKDAQTASPWWRVGEFLAARRERKSDKEQYGTTLFDGTCGFFAEAVAKHLSRFGASVSPERIECNDGERKNFVTFFGRIPQTCKIAVPLPAHPNVIASAKAHYNEVYFFVPKGSDMLPRPTDIEDFGADVVYLSQPCDVCGAAFDGEDIREWVDYAKEYGTVLLWDMSGGMFCRAAENGQKFPSTVFGVDDADGFCIEMYSFMPSFCGAINCGYSVVPDGAFELLEGKTGARLESALPTKVRYSLQKGAAEALRDDGEGECLERARGYLYNAQRIGAALAYAGFSPLPCKVSPYVFANLSKEAEEVAYFSELTTGNKICEFLERRAGVRALSGAAFGLAGGGYVRLSGTVPVYLADSAVYRILRM